MSTTPETSVAGIAICDATTTPNHFAESSQVADRGVCRQISHRIGHATSHPHWMNRGDQTTDHRPYGFPQPDWVRVPRAPAGIGLPQTGAVTIFGTVARRHELTRSVHAEAAKTCGHPPGRGLSSGTGRAIKCPGERPDTAHGKRRHHRAHNRRAWCVSRGVRRTGTRQSIVVAHDAMPRLSGAIARASG